MNNSFLTKARFLTLALSIALLPFSMRFCHLSLLFFLVTCVAEGNFSQRLRLIKSNPLAWILPLFFAFHVAGIFWSGNAHDALVNLDKKFVFALIPPIVVSSRPFEKKELQNIAWIFVVACVAGTIICFANACLMASDAPLWNFGPPDRYTALHPESSTRWAYFSYIGLASGIDIHPTYFSFYLLICIVIVLNSYTAAGRGILHLALAGYLLIFIVLLSSRIVVLTTITTIVGWMLINIRQPAARAGAAVGLALIVTVLFLNPIARYRNTQEYVASSFSLPPPAMADNPISIRTSLWWLSAKAAGEMNPFFGNGTGTVNKKIAKMADRYDAHNILGTSDPHNQVLHTYIALGLAGVAILIASFVVPLLYMFRAKEYLVCFIIAAFFIVGLTESVMELQKGIVPFTLFVALAGNYARTWNFSTQQAGYA